MIDDTVQNPPMPATGPHSAPGDDSGWRRLLSQTPADLQRRRERHHRRPIIVRGGVVVAGGILSVAGALLLLPFPDVGLPLLLLALGLLSLEFDWAARLMGHVITWAAYARMQFQRLSRLNKALVALVALGLIALITWVLFLR
jgi:hypothetical protein